MPVTDRTLRVAGRPKPLLHGHFQGLLKHVKYLRVVCNPDGHESQQIAHFKARSQVSEPDVVPIPVPDLPAQFTDRDSVTCTRRPQPSTSTRITKDHTTERGERCYAEATERLRQLAGSTVRLEDGPRLQDTYGRRLGYLYTGDGLSIDVLLIGEGLARAWTRDGQHRDTLMALEESARQESSGMPVGVAPLRRQQPPLRQHALRERLHARSPYRKQLFAGWKDRTESPLMCFRSRRANRPCSYCYGAAVKVLADRSPARRAGGRIRPQDSG